jgi:putative FmdB family regulatory protein
MPIYEFHCKDCSGDFRALRPADRITEVECPNCSGKRVSRLLSVTARTQQAAEPVCAAPGGCCRMGPEACGCRG